MGDEAAQRILFVTGTDTGVGKTWVTCGVARALVEENLAACVNIVGQVCSVYRWEGQVTREEEKLLVIKTAERLLPRVKSALREKHTYDVPEILALPIQDGDPDYLAWLSGCLAD